jgi:6-phosphogluconolactonase
MKRSLLAIGVSIALAALASVGAHADEPTSELVYIGTHGTGRDEQPDPNKPQGIYAARFDTRTGHLTPLGLQVELERATWLVAHPTLPILYSVANGTQTESNIYSFVVNKAAGVLTEINRVGSGGSDATHLDLDTQSNTLFVANHGSGDVTALTVQPDGSLGKLASSQKTSGTGPHRRQKMPQPHGVGADPSHRYLLATDFGADRVYVYRFDGSNRTLSPATAAFESLPPGSGPRHLVFHPTGKYLYLNTELTAELRTYGWDAQSGRMHLIQTLSPYPAGYSGAEKSAAEVARSSDGRFVYLSVRGDQDNLVVYAVNDRLGTLQEIQRLAAQGKTPWSFGIDPTGRWMLVTNEASNSVTVFRVDTSTGKLAATSESLSIPKPVTVAFYK